MSVKVSIIIRAKNEERWIGACLKAISEQTIQDYEVILIDNQSTDKTVAKASRYNVRLITLSEFLPGHAINVGVRASSGEFIVCLSAHCIPKDKFWLENLLRNFDDPLVAGVYGRQEPLAQTSPKDKRDLLITFGLDRRIQVKDSFFHNANSMIRRSVWNAIPFDETVSNIEDRVWGQKIISQGYKIAYEPEASVFHYHGIHQNGDEERVRGVVRVMESLDMSLQKDDFLLEEMNIVAIIPIKGDPVELAGRPLWTYTLERARSSRFIKKVYISTDNKSLGAAAQAQGAEAPIMRPTSLSGDDVGIEPVLQYTLGEIEKSGTLPDLVVSLNIQFPFRTPDLIDDLIRLQFEKGFDSVLPGVPTFRSCWQETPEGLKRIDQGFQSHQVKKPIHVGYAGLACVSFPSSIRQGHLLGEKVGIYEVLDNYATIEVKDTHSHDMASKLMPEWWVPSESPKTQTQESLVG
jgi:rhamnosyltransferase